ncbi:MAG: leucine-rich repeat protein [Firmicutes bacterium]|nr:leucine-rich repeat protein [Bacillota bacterium]
MKKTIRFRRTASLTIAAIMAISAYMPVAAFADVEEGAPAQQPAAAEQQEAAPAPAPAQSTPAPAAQSAPAAAEQPSSEPASAGSSDQDLGSETQQAEEPSYGEATGNWGYGNDTKTTKWTEYTNGNETILVFSTTGESDSDEENAVTQILDQDGKSQKDKLKNKVTQVIFETGITGIGWTALYTDKGYEPLYDRTDHTVDQSKTDVFKDFSVLRKVIPCETIKKIGWSAFRKCYNLSEFDFTKCPELEIIMNQAFNECKSLNTVDLSNCKALETIAQSAFAGAGKGGNATLELPEEGVLSVIGGYAFYQYASKNAASSEVDFSRVAGSVTKILQNAFNGAKLAGEISGFKNLETIANNALKGSNIDYIPYVAPVDEETNEEQPAEEPAAPAEEPAAPAEEPAEGEVSAEESVITADAADAAAIPATASEAAAKAAIVSASSSVANPAAAGRTAIGAALFSAAHSTIGDGAAPMAAPATDTVAIDQADMPASAPQADSSMIIIFGSLAAAMLMAMAATVVIGMRRKDSDK